MSEWAIESDSAQVAGPIPEELQTRIGFAAGLSSVTQEPDTAKTLIAYISGSAAEPTLRAHGIEPVR